MTDEFKKPRFLWPKPTFWAGDKEILEYRREKIIRLTAILAVGNGLDGVEVVRALYEAEY